MMIRPSIAIVFLAVTTAAQELEEVRTRFGRFITSRFRYAGGIDPRTGCYGLEAPYQAQLQALTNIEWSCRCNPEGPSVVCNTDQKGEACCDGDCGYFSTGVKLDTGNIDNINFMRGRNECFRPSLEADFFCVDYTWAADSADAYESCTAHIANRGTCNSCQMNQCLVIGDEGRPSFDCSNAPALPLSGKCPELRHETNFCIFTPDELPETSDGALTGTGTATSGTTTTNKIIGGALAVASIFALI